jgi:hypothetical protein
MWKVVLALKEFSQSGVGLTAEDLAFLEKEGEKESEIARFPPKLLPCRTGGLPDNEDAARDRHLEGFPYRPGGLREMLAPVTTNDLRGSRERRTGCLLGRSKRHGRPYRGSQ